MPAFLGATPDNGDVDIGEAPGQQLNKACALQPSELTLMRD